MAGPRQTTLNALLEAMMELPAHQRSDWVESLAGEFAEHKPRLRALLSRSRRLESNPSLLTLPKLEAPSLDRPSQLPGQPLAGARVGRYQLVRRLGIGGMGVVWLATDASAPERPVALKFAHLAPHRPDLLSRLARERDLLSALRHPNIARLYDAGVSEDARPYLVLEYVQGIPLDEYCARNHLRLARRLALFVQVADAVAHAHQRRIVHRDLKPANVLVTSEGEARLLDFGVAKLLGDESIPVDLQLSHLSGRPLTPQYASPEQISGQDVGLSSDVFSLAVMLYELVAGVRPHVGAPDSTRGLREAIMERVPLPPSEVATDPECKVRLRHGLDAVILSALEKRPECRPSMGDLAASIEHHARVLARSP